MSLEDRQVLAEYVDHLEDARLALLAAHDMLNPGQSGYSMSAWQLAQSIQVTRLVKCIDQMKRGVSRG